jgi:hypothetical protein
MTKFVWEMKGGGMIAGVFEILSDCGKKLVADTVIVRREGGLGIV